MSEQNFTENTWLVLWLMPLVRYVHPVRFFQKSLWLLTINCYISTEFSLGGHEFA